MPLFLLTLPLLFRAASMYCHPLTVVLDLMSMLRRPKSCPLPPIVTLMQLLFLCMAIALLRHGSVHTWGVYWVLTAVWTVKLRLKYWVLRLLLLPSADCCVECSSITIVPSPPRWLSTRLSMFRCCFMVAKHGPLFDDTLRPWGFYRHIRCLQTVLGVRWWPHVELFSKANITPVEHLLVQRQLRLLGHVIRLPDNRLPRRLLYGELSQGQRAVGRP